MCTLCPLFCLKRVRTRHNRTGQSDILHWAYDTKVDKIHFGRSIWSGLKGQPEGRAKKHSRLYGIST